MIILTSIYQILIGPLELFFETVFSIAYKLIGDPGAAIIALSLAMNFLVLPLYRRADAMQEAERDRAARMKPAIDHIKRTFKGDERFMVLQTYYRQNGYKQTDALKGSISLLLEIPFFIAAYHFLSNLELLRGVPFGPIVDLGAPDGLLQIGGITINVLPLIMTAINVVSAAIYMKGFPIRSKVQMYGIAAIFLVLLYASPAGLVFYWTLNNLFSLVKNLFYKLKHPGKVLTILSAATGAVCLVCGIFVLDPSLADQRTALVVLGVLLEMPLLVVVLKRKARMPRIPEATKKDDRAFLFGSLFLALLTGVLIPISVIQASPAEFVDIAAFETPLRFVWGSFTVAFGTFVVWLGIFYRLASPSGRYLFGIVLLVSCGASLINYLFFGTNYGYLSPLLQYDLTPSIGPIDMVINLAAIAALAAVLFLIWRHRRAAVQAAYACMCIAIAAVSVMGVVQINSDLDTALATGTAADQKSPHFTLSREGQNVVVIMMDRAIAEFVPYIVEEYPKIGQQFDGFTYYPNTLSYGSSTNVGVPGIYGGYEYIPENMNARTDATLPEKQNEALRVMPLLFDDNGYDVTVFDPTYAGYGWTPDLTIYDDRPNISTYMTMNGAIPSDEFGIMKSTQLAESLQSRNFFCYSVFKIAPQILQPVLYDYGSYNSAAALPPAVDQGMSSAEYQSPQIIYNVSQALGVHETFLKSYAVLQNLPEMTEVSDTGEGGFLMMSNNTTHEPTVLQEPGCIPATLVDNRAYDSAHVVRYDALGNALDFTYDTDRRAASKHMHYEVNVAAWRELGNWLDYLREQGVYDNTRIIVVSDHGRYLHLHDDMELSFTDTATGSNLTCDTQVFNCLLMVKDFNATGFTTDGRFMTNADVPLLAMEGIVDDPVNPSTGKQLDDADKHSPEHHVQWPSEWSTKTNNGTAFLPGRWLSLEGDNVLDPNAWSYIGTY